jgi:hypothetical protein
MPRNDGLLFSFSEKLRLALVAIGTLTSDFPATILTGMAIFSRLARQNAGSSVQLQKRRGPLDRDRSRWPDVGPFAM